MQLMTCYLACDPKLMPTFPQHRNIKTKSTSGQEGGVNTGAGDQTNNLPAISDLVLLYMYCCLHYIDVYLFLAWFIGKEAPC